ncbi:hypothetical protein FACS189449_05680 [Alphaproteobacteria bacterium]|nr:hypothetical protein FACS189449_05680 [Alphaproteobacteria bacterium]
MNGYTPPLGDGGDVVSPSAVCPPDRPWSNVFRPASAPPADDLDGTLELRSLAARGEVSKERDQWRLEQQKLGQRLDQQKLEQQRLAQMLEQQRLDQERERLSHEQQRLNQDYQAQLQKQEQQKAKLQEERKELLKDLQVLLSVFSKPRSVCLDADSKVAISGTCKFLGVRKHLVAISDGGVVLSPDKVVEVCARLARSVSSADFKFFEEFEAKRMKDGDYDLVCRYLYKAFGDIMIGGMAEDIYIGRSRSIDRNGGCMIM